MSPIGHPRSWTAGFLVGIAGVGVAVPMLSVGISILWTMAFMALAYGELNQVTVAAPQLSEPVAIPVFAGAEDWSHSILVSAGTNVNNGSVVSLTSMV